MKSLLAFALVIPTVTGGAAAVVEDPAAAGLAPLAPSTGALAPDESALALAATDGSLVLVELEGGSWRTLVGPHDSRIESLCWAPDGLSIAVLRADGRVRFVTSEGRVARAELDCTSAEFGPGWTRRRVSFAAGGCGSSARRTRCASSRTASPMSSAGSRSTR